MKNLNKKVKCYFCGKEMKIGPADYMGKSLRTNCIGYWCECGSRAIFLINNEGKQITNTKIECSYTK